MRPWRRPSDDEGLSVFVPALMGVGILISGILVLADWLRKLIPSAGLRRKHEMVKGALGIVTGVAETVGVSAEGPDLSRRVWRSRLVYLLAAIASVGVGALISAAMLAIWADEQSVYHENPWLLGIAIGSFFVFGLLSAQLLFMALVHRRAFRALHVLVESSWFGRMSPPPATPKQFAQALKIRPTGGRGI